MADKAKQVPWAAADAMSFYAIDAWGRGSFSINQRGHLTVGNGSPEACIDLKELVDEVAERGIDPPLLIRFSDILKLRIAEIHRAFEQAIAEYEYQGSYRGVYPIKVNQNSFLVEDLMSFGEPFHYGLEAGSKPELLAVMAMLRDSEALVICNGYKDSEYIETALWASRLGPKVVLVVEKPSELPQIMDISRQLGIEPCIGVRSRLATRGAGHWEASGGDRSKFGLSTREMLEAVEYLRQHDALDRLILLHFHLGSQISSIRNIKDALREASWLYVNLVQMGVPLTYFDVGGGLGVDYAGTQRNSTSSMNYTLQEYANDIVYGVMEVCDPAGVHHPILVTEAGRATVAHHAMLVIEVLGAREFHAVAPPAVPPPDSEPALLHLFETYAELKENNVRETYHDALQYRDECLSLFKLGYLSLHHRVLAEDLFSALCQKIRQRISDLPEIPKELQDLEETLADIYFANFSLFQSLPDSWAIDQIFPIVPIHRLNEKPTRSAVIADMTCDSDGQIDHFIHHDRIKSSLPLHLLRDGESYYLGVMMVGAYQEILGDLHNLFGDTNTVQVAFDPDGGYHIEHVISGDNVTDVLRYVGYKRSDLVARVRRATEGAIRAQRMTREEARQLLELYQQGLSGYTYLERR